MKVNAASRIVVLKIIFQYCFNLALVVVVLCGSGFGCDDGVDEQPKPEQVEDSSIEPTAPAPSSFEYIPMQNECCTHPGDIASCWYEDAKEDGVACTNSCSLDLGCETVSLAGNNYSLCKCNSHSDCATNICIENTCRPSYCNGYRICSCWGGCVAWHAEYSADPPYTPEVMCNETGRDCDNGEYPSNPLRGNRPLSQQNSGFGSPSGSIQ